MLPFLIFPKPVNKLYTKDRFWDWKLTSCDVTLEWSQQEPYKLSFDLNLYVYNRQTRKEGMIARLE